MSEQRIYQRKEYIKKLRKRSGWHQFFAVLFLIGGFVLQSYVAYKEATSLYLTLITIGLFVFGIGFQVSTIINFNAAKKHINGIASNK